MPITRGVGFPGSPGAPALPPGPAPATDTSPPVRGGPTGHPLLPVPAAMGTTEGRAPALCPGEERPGAPALWAPPSRIGAATGTVTPVLQGMVEGHLTTRLSPPAVTAATPSQAVPTHDRDPPPCSWQGPSWYSRFGAVLVRGWQSPEHWAAPHQAGEACWGCAWPCGCPAPLCACWGWVPRDPWDSSSPPQAPSRGQLGDSCQIQVQNHNGAWKPRDRAGEGPGAHPEG